MDYQNFTACPSTNQSFEWSNDDLLNLHDIDEIIASSGYDEFKAPTFSFDFGNSSTIASTIQPEFSFDLSSPSDTQNFPKDVYFNMFSEGQTAVPVTTIEDLPAKTTNYLLISIPEDMQADPVFATLPSIDLNDSILKKVAKAAKGYDGVYLDFPLTYKKQEKPMSSRPPFRVIQRKITCKEQKSPPRSSNKRKQNFQLTREDGLSFFEDNMIYEEEIVTIQPLLQPPKKKQQPIQKQVQKILTVKIVEPQRCDDVIVLDDISDKVEGVIQGVIEVPKKKRGPKPNKKQEKNPTKKRETPKENEKNKEKKIKKVFGAAVVDNSKRCEGCKKVFKKISLHKCRAIKL